MAPRKTMALLYCMIDTTNQSKKSVGVLSRLYQGKAGLLASSVDCKTIYAEIDAKNQWARKYPTIWRVTLECAAAIGREVPWESDWCVPLTSEEYESWRAAMYGARTCPSWRGFYNSKKRVRPDHTLMYSKPSYVPAAHAF